MFNDVKLVLSYMIQWWTMITNNLLYGMSYVGISVIGFIILRKIVDVWRKVRG